MSLQWVVASDYLLLAMGVAYLVGAWLATAVAEPPSNWASGLPLWRDARAWARALAPGFAAWAGLIVWSEYVPHWDQHRVVSMARLPAYAVVPATLALFQHLGYVVSGSRLPGLTLQLRVAGFSAALGVSIFCLGWPVSHLGRYYVSPHQFLTRPDFCSWTFAFMCYVYPLLLLVVLTVVFLRAARAGDRPRREG